MRIAIASSGLGYIARGIETWAMDTAKALYQRGIDVTLFAGGELSSADGPRGRGPSREASEETDAPRGGTAASPSACREASGLRTVALPCWRRYSRKAGVLRTLMPAFAWRWGLKDGYGIEQLTFWWHLKKALVGGAFDILHVQDPMVAYWCARARKKGRLATREILAHGTEESAQFLSQFDYVQHLAPWHLENAERSLEDGGR